MTNSLYKHDLPSGLNLGNIIAIDTEAMGLNNHRDRLCLVQISSGNGDTHLVQFERGNFKAPNLVKILQDKNIVKIFHFARFDVALLKNSLKTNINNIYCTKIASKLCRTYTDSHGLKVLVEEIVKVDLSKKQQSSDWGSDDITEEQIKYAASDVLYLHAVKERLDLMLKREGRTELAQKCFDFIQTRCELDLAGFDFDIFKH